MKHEDYLHQQLKDDDFAIGYLQEALQDEDYRVFILALNDLINARSLVKTSVAKESGLSRNGLYTALNEKANPEFASIKNILNAIGYELSVQPKRQGDA